MTDESHYSCHHFNRMANEERLQVWSFDKNEKNRSTFITERNEWEQYLKYVRSCQKEDGIQRIYIPQCPQYETLFMFEKVGLCHIRSLDKYVFTTADII